MSKEVLMAYTVFDKAFMNGLVKKIEGEPAAAQAEVASIQDPDETYVPLSPDMAEQRIFSYALGLHPAVLAATVSPGAGAASTCKYTLAAPNPGGEKAWQVLGKDVVLEYTDTEKNPPVTTPEATNPYGIAQVGNTLYVIDYDSQKITLLGVNELNGLPPGYCDLAAAPYDLGPGTAANLPANAHGQAIIALKDESGNPFLFALYTVFNSGYPLTYNSSILVKIIIDPEYGVLGYGGQINTLAKNARELIYIQNFDNSPGLLIPALGGDEQNGTTNGTDSKLQLVRPFASPMSFTTLLTGDPVSTTPTTWDIKAVAAAPDTAGASPIFILTGILDANGDQNWRLYNITVNNLKSKSNTPLSSASGLYESDSANGTPGTYWDIYYENGTTSGSPAGDRLWFLRGSPIVVGVTPGFPYNAKTFPVGYGQGQIGGLCVASATLVTETMKQAVQGLSLKRGLRGIARRPRRKEAEEKK